MVESPINKSQNRNIKTINFCLKCPFIQKIIACSYLDATQISPYFWLFILFFGPKMTQNAWKTIYFWYDLLKYMYLSCYLLSGIKFVNFCMPNIFFRKCPLIYHNTWHRVVPVLLILAVWIKIIWIKTFLSLLHE